MKIPTVLFCAGLFMFECTTKPNKANSSDSILGWSIYDYSFKSNGFQQSDYTKLKEISAENPEKLNVIPDSIAFRLTSRDTSQETFYCRWIDSKIGEFRIIANEYSNDFLVSFSENGEILDFLAFKSSAREKSNEMILYSKFYTNFYYEGEYIIIDELDTTVYALHPDAATVLRSHIWYLDPLGKFKKKLN